MIRNFYELEPRHYDDKGFNHKAHVVVYENGAKTLYSYEQPILTVLGNFAMAHYKYGLSNTTARHLKEFCGMTAAEFDKLEYVDVDEKNKEDLTMARFVPEVEIRERFNGLEEITEKQERWLTHDVIPNYMFYSRKENVAHCSACGEDVDFNLVKDVRQGKEIVCPKCKSVVKGRCLSYGHNFSDSGTGVILSKLGTQVVVRFYDVCRSYVRDFRKPYGYIDEVVRDVYKGDGISEVYDNKKQWAIVREAYSAYYGWHWAQHVKLHQDSIRLYTDNIDEVLKGTRYEHCELKAFAQNCDIDGSSWMYGDYLSRYEETSMWEYLMKMGMFHFAETLWKSLSGYDSWNLDYKAKTLQDILRITRVQLADLKAHPEVGAISLKFLRDGLTMDDFLNYNVKEFTSDRYTWEHFKKVYPYKEKSAKFRKWYDESDAPSLETYIDYLKLAKEIGWDMRDSSVLYPKNLKKVHDTAVKVYNAKKQEIKTAKMAKFVKAATEKYTYENEKLRIVIPKTAGDISNEGVRLHHCVGTYVDRVANGETNILFVRRKTQPGRAYYTMEVDSDNKLRQCRGKNNCQMTDEVKTFVKEFCKAKKIQQTLVA